MNLIELKVGAVVRGQDSVSVVLSEDAKRVLVVTGSPTGLGTGSDVEVTVQDAAEVAACGLKQPMRFDLLTHVEWVDAEAAQDLVVVGELPASVDWRVRKAMRATLAYWQYRQVNKRVRNRLAA